MTVSKFVLGTAQLGNAYGVNNAVGELDENDAFAVLESAAECGVRVLDTAEAYGKSQEVIGHYIASHPDCGFSVCTKLSGFVNDSSGFEIDKRVEQQLELLKCDSIFIYYLHDFSMCKDRQTLVKLATIRERGLLQNVGVSIYEPQELEFILSQRREYVDAVQIPFNVFNCHRWFENDLLKRSAETGLVLLARSVYLQGMVFMKPDDAKVVQLGMTEHVRRFRDLADRLGESPGRLAADFVKSVDEIGYVLFGAETPEQVRENVASFSDSSVWNNELIAQQVTASSAIPDNSVDPRYW